MLTQLLHSYVTIDINYLVTRFTGRFYLRDLRVPVQNNNMVAYMKSAFTLLQPIRWLLSAVNNAGSLAEV